MIPTVSGSGLERVMECPPSAVLPQMRIAGEWAEAGGWRHRFLEVGLVGGDRAAAMAAVPEEYRETCSMIDLEVLRKLLPERRLLEVPLAYNWRTGQARALPKSDTHRYYSTVTEDEIPLQMDLLGFGDDLVVDLDFKTGHWRVTAAKKNPQLLLGALAATRVHGYDTAIGGVVYLREDEDPITDVAKYDEMVLDAFAYDVRQTMLQVDRARPIVLANRIPDLNAGDWCKYCPALRCCPTYTGLIRAYLERPEAIVDNPYRELTDEEIAVAWERMRKHARVVGEARKALESIAAERTVRLHDGRLLGMAMGPRRVKDADAARSVLVEMHGREVADESLSIKWVSSIGAMKRVMIKHGIRPKEREETFHRLERAGAISVSRKVREHADGKPVADDEEDGEQAA